MKAKKTVRVFVFGLFFTSLILVSLIFYLEFTGKLKDRSAYIVLPNDGGYVESWAPYLSQLSRVLGVSDLSIKTYTNEKDLYELLEKTESFNILWIEIPLKSSFSLQKAIDNKLLMPLCNPQTVLETSPLVVQNIFLSHFSQEASELFTLPFTMNPLIQVYKHENAVNNTKNELLVPLQTSKDFKVFYAFTKALFYPYLNHLSEEEFIIGLPSFLNFMHLDPQSVKHQPNELLPYFLKNNNKSLLMYASDLEALSVEQRLSVSISSFGKNICSDFSYLVFPARTSENYQEKIRNAQEYLLIPEVAFNIANKRNVLSVNLEAISKNVFNDFIKKQVRQAENCIVPALENDLINTDTFRTLVQNYFINKE